MALMGRVRATMGQVQGARFRPAGGAGGQGAGSLPQSGFAKRWWTGILRGPARTKAGFWRVKSPKVLTWVVPSEGHHFASCRKPIALDEVGRNGSLGREDKHAPLRQTLPAWATGDYRPGMGQGTYILFTKHQSCPAKGWNHKHEVMTLP